MIEIQIGEIAGTEKAAGQKVARLGPCSRGAVNAVYEFGGGDAGIVADVLGFGPLAAATRRALKHARHETIAIPTAIDVAGTIGAVVQTGAGPTVTATATPAASPVAAGPWFDAPNLTLEIVVGGVLGVARARLKIDGHTPAVEAFNLPTKYPASITGTADLTALSLASLNGLTVDLSDVDGANPAAITITTPVDVDDLLTQIDAIVGASASLVGGKYLRLAGMTLGSGGSISNGSGTANALLGLTNGQSGVGVDAIHEVDGLGVRFTFATGTYEKDTTYATAVSGPKSNLSSISAGLDALRNSGVKFAIFAPVQTPVDGLDCKLWQTLFETKRQAWAAAEENPLFTKWIFASPLGIEGSANWAANDQDIKASLAGTQEANKLNTIVHGDVWLQFDEYGEATFRSPLAFPYVERCAGNEISINPGLGSKNELPATFLHNAAKTVYARTEAVATVKMQSAGFAVAMNQDGKPYIRSGVTRAPTTSQFTGEHTARMVLAMAASMYALAFRYKDATPPLEPGGDLNAVDKGAIRGTMQSALEAGFVGPRYASSVAVELLPLQSSGGSDLLPVRVRAQRLSHIQDASIEITVAASTATFTE